MSNKFVALICALSVIGLFSFCWFGVELSHGNATGWEGSLSTDLGNVTTTITDIFVAIIPMVAIIAVFGGLMGALPRMFKFFK